MKKSIWLGLCFVMTIALSVVVLLLAMPKSKSFANMPESIGMTADEAIFLDRDYPVDIQKIDKKVFISAQKQAVQYEPIPKITNFQIAKKLLKGVVTFQTDEPDYPSPLKIKFRNGVIIKEEDSNVLSDVGFVAYFPSEDILLFEGGHASDYSLNLSNGKETELTGNPEYIVQSPKNKNRLNAYFTGQECSVYFIQQYKHGEWLKTIELSEIFKIKNGGWLCVIQDAFWTDENTLYVSHLDNYDEDKAIYGYYKITLNLTEKRLNWSDFQAISFPKKIESVTENHQLSEALDKARAKYLLAGLYPDVTDFKKLYSVPFSDNFTSVVVAFRQNQNKFIVVLFNLDKNGQLIDYLEISNQTYGNTDIVTQSLLDKDLIIVKNHLYTDLITKSYQISPDGRFILKDYKKMSD